MVCTAALVAAFTTEVVFVPSAVVLAFATAEIITSCADVVNFVVASVLASSTALLEVEVTAFATAVDTAADSAVLTTWLLQS
jgi:hypothetical protein